MLTLTRKDREEIVIYDRHDPEKIIAVIVIKQIRRNQVRIGVEAGEELGIHRAELHDELVNDIWQRSHQATALLARKR